MAQVLPNEFTQIEFSDKERLMVLLSFTEQQIQYLQNYRGAAAQASLFLVFGDDGESDAKSIREHAYQRGRIDLIGDVVSDIASARERTSEEDSNLDS